MIEKLVKEFEKIYASLGKSKKLILADIDKIDEKYRKLAQEEKKNLTDSLAILNEQMKYYSTILGGNAGEAKDEVVEEEPAIEDTIFPENNVQEEKVEVTATVEKIEEPVFETTETETENEPKEETKTIEEPVAADVVPADSSATADNVAVEWPDNAVEEKEVKKEEEPVAVFATDDNGWPIPDDWK